MAGKGAGRQAHAKGQSQGQGQGRPSAGELVGLARARLAAELSALPPWESPLLWARLRLTAGPQVVTLGALVHHLRAAVQWGDAARTRDLFALLLLRRIERENARWAAQVVERTPALRGAEAEAEAACDDLLQELALRVWLEVGTGTGEGWELFFSRALAYARQHTAAAYMQQRGLWTRAGVRLPTRAVPHMLSRLAIADGDSDGDEGLAGVQVADGRDHFSAAELADLRAHVRTLPAREQVAVVMRYWEQAPEAEIAAALRVSTRTVRTYLQQAYQRLRAAYDGTEGGR